MTRHFARCGSLRALALAGAASLALLAGAGAAQAQFLGVWQFGVASRGYFDEPRDDLMGDDFMREDFARPGAPQGAIRATLSAEGYVLVSPLRRNGRVYIAEVEDRRGRSFRVVLDARDGEILERFARGGPPRPPGGMGRDDVWPGDGGRDDPRRSGGPGAYPDPFETGRAEAPFYRDTPPDDVNARRMGALPALEGDGSLRSETRGSETRGTETRPAAAPRSPSRVGVKPAAKTAPAKIARTTPVETPKPVAPAPAEAGAPATPPEQAAVSSESAPKAPASVTQVDASKPRSAPRVVYPGPGSPQAQQKPVAPVE